MSRLTKKPIILPEGVTVQEDGSAFSVRGPKGTVVFSLPHGIKAKSEEGKLFISGEGLAVQRGTAWAHARNAVEGVSRGFTKTLDIEGVGFRATLEGTTLVLNLGFTNPIRFPIPEGIMVVVEKGSVTISGIRKDLVGEVAARIRALKEPEPYKGKGIRYRGEVVRRKAGKKAAAAAGTSG